MIGYEDKIKRSNTKSLTPSILTKPHHKCPPSSPKICRPTSIYPRRLFVDRPKFQKQICMKTPIQNYDNKCKYEPYISPYDIILNLSRVQTQTREESTPLNWRIQSLNRYFTTVTIGLFLNNFLNVFRTTIGKLFTIDHNNNDEVYPNFFLYYFT